MSVRLTEGAVEVSIVLNCMYLLYFITLTNPPRIRLILSDGVHTSASFIIATQLNHLFNENQLEPYCVCLLKKVLVNTLKDGRRAVVVMDMEIIKSAEEMGEKIGNPVPYNSDSMDLNIFIYVFNQIHHHHKRELILILLPLHLTWTVRARVTNKSKVRTWSNSKGEGKLFSFEIVDESGEIKITAFNNEVDKFFSLVEQGKVYFISKATLKVANKQFNTLKHEYEMTEKDTIIDVIGVCKSAEDVSRITTKTSREVSKRALSLMDMSGKMVTVTLWGEEAEKFDGSGQPIVAIKGARLSDFGGRSLSALFSSTILVNPDIPAAFRLRTWFDREGHAVDSQSLTEARPVGSGARMNWKTLSDVKTEHMGHREKADYFSCVATVVYIRKENCLYQACPSSDCNKKVLDQHNGLYRCEKCNRDYPNFQYRLLLSANLADFGDNQWVTCFQETAEVLLGHSAERLGQLRETDEEAFELVFQKANFTTHIFKNRVKLETYNDESRVKVTVLEILPMDHRDYARRLVANIHKMSGSA
uniref:Replication protein A subunit n=1 Tax=Neogobius melanostomus TaxID=47308 RepID=A0A8C6SYI9_9GOBI